MILKKNHTDPKIGKKDKIDDYCSKLTQISSPYSITNLDDSTIHDTDSYFTTMMQMEEAVSKHDYESAARLVHVNLKHIPNFLEYIRREHGTFSSVPALQQGGTILALLDDEKGLEEMRQIVAAFPELKAWVDEVGQHQHDRLLFKAILKEVAAHPNCLQTDIKSLIGETDGHRIAKLISYLEKAKRITRIKKGHSYELVIVGSQDVLATQPKRKVEFHRLDRKPLKIKEIDISSLNYVPLPRSPLRWEEKQTGRESSKLPEPEIYFEVREANWQIVSIEKIPKAERPDPAFRQMHPSDSGLWMIDDLGKAEGLGQIEAAVLRYDRAGNLVAKAGLLHGIYRLGVHPQGRGLIAMSPDCIVHAYNEKLDLLFETALDETPEILALKKRFEIQQLKNAIRCVALSQDSGRYLFTVVDEAWCIDVRGKGLWGAKLPIKEGWTRVATPSAHFGTSDDVKRSLDLMNLSFPISHEEVKRRYRELAKRWHPDLNPGDSKSEEKMKALNSAAEVLTGIAASTLPSYTGAMFTSEMKGMKFEVGGINFTLSAGFLLPEIQASDWIYAASFAAKSNSVYLAGYSGRVVLVDEKGDGVRVYDIGSVPRRIVDTDDYLYLLTDTRLYILREDVLYALIDTFDSGDLVVAQTSFGLIEDKRLRWFLEDGTYLGSIVSKAPIRRIYSVPGGMIIETRQHRSIIKGVPGWWD